MENIHKFTQYTHFCLLQKNDLSRLNNLFMVCFQLIRMSSYAKNKQQMCWVNQHQCRSRQMWKIFTNWPSTHTFGLLQRMTSLAKTIYSWYAFNSLGCLTYTKNKLQMCCVTQHQCRSRQIREISHIFTSVALTFSLLQKMTCLDCTILFVVSFHLIRMSSYANNKLQMCWVT